MIRQPALRVLALLSLAVEIVVHVALAPAHVEEVPYVGWLFVAASVLLLLPLVGLLLTPADDWPWLAGAALCTGMGVAFVVSRTWGLPDYHEGWASDGSLGLVSLAFDACFLVAAGAARRPTPSASPVA